MSRLGAAGPYVAVYTEAGLSPRIVARTAAAPEGPWSAAVRLYECPEAGWDKNVFCYAAKAHPELAAAEDELVISYCANSFDFFQRFLPLHQGMIKLTVESLHHPSFLFGRQLLEILFPSFG